MYLKCRLKKSYELLKAHFVKSDPDEGAVMSCFFNTVIAIVFVNCQNIPLCNSGHQNSKMEEFELDI